MKHLLNNLSDEEKNSIREQHNGGMSVDTSRFKYLIESKSGDIIPLIYEDTQYEEFVTPTMDMLSYGVVYTLIGNGGDGKTINSKKSLSGNEYKFTLPEGMYKSLERINIDFTIVGKLKLQKKVLSTDITKSDNVTYTKVWGNSERGENLRDITFIFNMPKTQTEFKENSPYIAYVDVPCENVRGGKLRFSVEVPSGSEIFELPENPLKVNDTEMGGDYE